MIDPCAVQLNWYMWDPPSTQNARSLEEGWDLDVMILAVPLLAVGLSTLYDLPVSNHGARVRMLVYKKGLEDKVRILSPMELGGLRSSEFMAFNPQGKMPLLVEDEDANPVWESDAICRHILDRYAGAPGPSFWPANANARTASEVLCRLHDAYIGPIQGCLYKPVPPFGRFGTRADAIRELIAQLGNVESLADPEGPFLTGPDISLADATLFPTMVFITHVSLSGLEAPWNRSERASYAPSDGACVIVFADAAQVRRDDRGESGVSGRRRTTRRRRGCAWPTVVGVVGTYDHCRSRGHANQE